MSVESGGQVKNVAGFICLGSESGSTGTVTVPRGSQLTDNGLLYVGYFGSGTLTVADGGMVTAGTLFASLDNLLGNGTIAAKGAVLVAEGVLMPPADRSDACVRPGRNLNRTWTEVTT